jgi:hypothetical protein
MGLFLKAIVVLSMLIGMHSRPFAADPCDVMAAMHEHGHDHHHHDHDHPGPCDSHENKCPPDHHHHHGAGCFCSGMPMIDHNDHSLRLLAPCFSLSRMRHDRESIPDGPFLSEDKPPLI